MRLQWQDLAGSIDSRREKGRVQGERGGLIFDLKYFSFLDPLGP